MDEEKFRRTSYVLGKEHSIDVLKLVCSRGWCKASDLAEWLDVHVATASSYLKELHEVGMLEQRKGMGKTREVLEYRVKDPIIELSFDLSLEKGDERAPDGLQKQIPECYSTLLKKVKTVCGTVPKELEKESHDDILGDLRMLLEYAEKRLGLTPTQKLVSKVCSDVPLDEDEIKYVMEKLPNKYFKLVEERIL